MCPEPKDTGHALSEPCGRGPLPGTPARIVAVAVLAIDRTAGAGGP
jgi:hypothetical protein